MCTVTECFRDLTVEWNWTNSSWQVYPVIIYGKQFTAYKRSRWSVPEAIKALKVYQLGVIPMSSIPELIFSLPSSPIVYQLHY